MKQNYLLAILFVMVIFGVSCQTDDVERVDTDVVISSDDGSVNNGDILRIFDTISYPISKKLIIMDTSAVYCPNNYKMPPTRYRTLKIRDRKGTVIQEWLLENLRTDLIECHYTWKDDPDGSKYGYFYQWQGELDDMEQDDWDYLMLATPNEKGEHKNGFHLPRYTDLEKLKKLVGGNGPIRNYLKLVYGGSYDKNSDSGKPCPGNVACIWLDFRHNYDIMGIYDGIDPNRKPGCGVLKEWSLDPNTSSRDYPNNKALCCNIRLIRDLTLEQW